MADTKTSGLTAYTTPIGADSTIILDSTNSLLKRMLLSVQHYSFFNQSVTSQTPFSSDTYLTGSNIAVPSGGPYVGSTYHAIFDVAKTGAGVAAPVISFRLGTAGSTADTAQCTFTFPAQTGVIDVGTIEVWITFRTVGSTTSAVVQGRAQIRHNLSITGFSTSVSPTLQVTSSGFDSTVASLIAGLSVNGGASAAWTVQLVRAELIL